MGPIDSILVATDFSPEAQHAAGRAGRIATLLGCASGTLAHVQEPAPLTALKQLLGGPDLEETRRHLNERLADAVENIEREHGFRLIPDLSAGRPLVELSRLAAAHDLVVLGARGQHQLRERLIGTLPQRLLGRIQQPLLVVRPAPEADYGSVVVGVDFSADSIQAVEWASAIAPEAPLHLVHAFRHPQELAMYYANVAPALIAEYRQRARARSEVELRRLVAASRRSAAPVTSAVEEGDPASALRKQADKVGAGLIVVGKRGTSEAEDLLFGSVVQHLLVEADGDVLVTPPR